MRGVSVELLAFRLNGRTTWPTTSAFPYKVIFYQVVIKSYLSKIVKIGAVVWELGERRSVLSEEPQVYPVSRIVEKPVKSSEGTRYLY
jgi:hypothetical protein